VSCYFTILTIEPARLVAAYDGGRDVRDPEFLNDYNVDDPFLASLVELFRVEAAAGHSDDTPLFAHLLGAFAHYFFDRYSGRSARNTLSATPIEDGTALPDGAVEAVQEYVRAHLGQSIRVEHLATHVGMGRFWFLKSFRRATGTTPYQYVLGMKVEEARALLRGSDLPLAQVAHSLGFADQSHFSRVFKRHVGLPPGLYRDQHAAE
jgi:AraC family transcriptional regulator